MFALRNKNTAVIPQPPAVVRLAPTVSLQQPKNVVFSFVTQPALPASLPTYTTVSYKSTQIIDAVLKNLSLYDIPASPSSLIRAGTKTTTWSRHGADFSTSISKEHMTVVFHQSKALIRPESIDENTTAAGQFITRLFSLPAGVSLSQTQVIDGPFDGLLILDSFGARKVQAINFSYTLNGIPIATTRGGLVSGSVIVDNLGIIRSATISPPPYTVSQTDGARIISKTDIISNLQQGRASVVSGYNPKTAGLGDSLTFHSFAIDKTTVVYGQLDGKLLPAFLLHGTGTDSTGVTQEATYFLWATP